MNESHYFGRMHSIEDPKDHCIFQSGIVVCIRYPIGLSFFSHPILFLKFPARLTNETKQQLAVSKCKKRALNWVNNWTPFCRRIVRFRRKRRPSPPPSSVGKVTQLDIQHQQRTVACLSFRPSIPVYTSIKITKVMLLYYYYIFN